MPFSPRNSSTNGMHMPGLNGSELKHLPMPPCGLGIYADCIYTITKTILIFGVIANATVILRVILDQNLRSATFLAIACLAFSDMIVLSMNLVEIVDRLILLLSCNLSDKLSTSTSWRAAKSVVWFASSAHITFIAIVRFIIVAYPFETNILLSPKRVLASSISIWLVGMIILFCTLEIVSTTTELGPANTVYLFIPLWIIVYIAPVILTSVLHIVKLRIAQRTAKNASSNVSHKSLTRMSKIIMVVIILAVTLPVPKFVLAILHQLNVNLRFRHVTSHLVNTASILGLLNHCINPFIYAFMSPAFRKSLKRMCFANVNR